MNENNRLLDFVAAITHLVSEEGRGEEYILANAKARLSELVAVDDWLDEEMARPHKDYYQQHLLYGDPLDRFSVVSFVWGPGQRTPIHNHTVWGVIGMLRGAEYGRRYAMRDQGLVAIGEDERLDVGQVEAVSPTVGDIHQVRNAYADAVSISIHVYGGNIGKIQRSVFEAGSKVTKSFVSGYSNTMTPNLWRRS
jgi:predicted metal-dependent enzyme (double-stranded beta helix superfamily)